VTSTPLQVDGLKALDPNRRLEKQTLIDDIEKSALCQSGQLNGGAGGDIKNFKSGTG
jgi:hypothetical protein